MNKRNRRHIDIGKVASTVVPSCSFPPPLGQILLSAMLTMLQYSTEASNISMDKPLPAISSSQKIVLSGTILHKSSLKINYDLHRRYHNPRVSFHCCTSFLSQSYTTQSLNKKSTTWPNVRRGERLPLQGRRGLPSGLKNVACLLALRKWSNTLGCFARKGLSYGIEV